ncbi:MAG: HD domain-containing protein [Desulfovibrionaceae bacterium]|nr:HD domain-containing protein [Desulfovibrionaceae bacterium]MBF0513427.1 HD domain-containing protein [Desulfovibrionaceae bacterium]
MPPKAAIETPSDLEEQYYQISPEIVQSFNKFRPPLDIFKFREDVGRVVTYYKVGERLSKEQTEELAELVGAGVMFVSRKDHPVYVKHISYQLDLVLQDRHLKENEIADIFVAALTRRIEEFMDQPVKPVLDKVNEDLLVLTQYLWEDPNRCRALARRMATDHTLARHSVNCGFIGLMLFLASKPGDFRDPPQNRQLFDRMALGLFLHDLGMTKIPAVLTGKKQQLIPDDRQKIHKHTMIGYEMLSKLDLKHPEIEQCVTQHHERMDGTGYPQKFKHKDISDAGALTALVDSYCAMISKRPYAEAGEPMKAAGALSEDRKYDPILAKLLHKLIFNLQQADRP